MFTSNSRMLLASLVSSLLLTSSVVFAQDSGTQPSSPSKTSGPKLGGHLGMAAPIVTVANKTTGIGSDFVTIGITPGITLHLDDRWAIDFEFIAFNEIKNTPAATTFIVDPGIVRKFDGFAAGLRVATQVGAPTNVGIVPIFVLPFKISEKVSYFVEADVPLFLRDNGTKIQPSATFLFQTGFGFLARNHRFGYT
jgi:hypothetical protein